jgi:hypothetical protein
LLFPLIDLFSPLAANLALKLQKAQDLVLRQHAALLGPHVGIDPDLIGLRGGNLFYRLFDSLFVIPFGPDLPFESLPRLAQASPGGNYFILAVAPYLLQPESLVGSQPDCAHKPLLQLLPLYPIVLGLPPIIRLAELGVYYSRVQRAALTWQGPVWIDSPLSQCIKAANHDQQSRDNNDKPDTSPSHL